MLMKKRINTFLKWNFLPDPGRKSFFVSYTDLSPQYIELDVLNILYYKDAGSVALPNLGLSAPVAMARGLGWWNC